MKKLFAIKDLSEDRVVEGLNFESKQAAKVERRKLNGIDDKTNKEKYGRYVVTPGVDHDDYVSEEMKKERERIIVEQRTRRNSRKKEQSELAEISVN